jgi:hypothetical protein
VVAGLFGLPASIWDTLNRLPGFFSAACLRLFAAADPGEYLKRIINKKRTEVNKYMTNLKDF